MKISYNWLKQFIKTDLTSDETASMLTDLGLEVETVDKFGSVKGGLQGIVVGEVLSCEKHPNADRLRVTKIDLGTGIPGSADEVKDSTGICLQQDLEQRGWNFSQEQIQFRNTVYKSMFRYL